MAEDRADARPDTRSIIHAIGVIGAGKVGRGIALAAAVGGYRTILEDLLPNALRRAESEFRCNLDQAIKLGRLSASAADAALSRLEFAGSVEEAARQADLVIEAGPEEMESKIEIFTLLDKICRPGTILVSNLAVLSISEIARVTYRARNCVGMRFFEAETGKRLEIIRGLETDDDTLATTMEVCQRMGREVV
ncbi:MAG: 3-hydroxyacyl-CoA dehydrogenase family protein, partial [Terriglobales bacterium]